MKQWFQAGGWLFASMLLQLAIPQLVCAAPFGSGFEALEKPLPRGLHHSAAPSRPGFPAALDSAASASSLVRGSLVRVAWRDLHPAPGQIDLSLLEREFARAETLNTRISLAVLDSWMQPAWLLAECEVFNFTFQGAPVRACLPWDPAYQARKRELLQALGAAYDQNPRLGLVYMSYAAMTNGIEMHWRVDAGAFAAAGYTPQRLLQAYTDVFDLHVEAFPHTPISMEVHEVFDSGALAQGAYAHCRQRLGLRCGVAIWWCAQRLTRPPGGESEVWGLARQASEQSFATCQTIGNFSNQPDRFDEGAGWTPLQALRNEMGFMYSAGVRHWELWSVDVTNTGFQTDLSAYRDALQP
jgi:hypothetical protein